MSRKEEISHIRKLFSSSDDLPWGGTVEGLTLWLLRPWRPTMDVGDGAVALSYVGLGAGPRVERWSAPLQAPEWLRGEGWWAPPLYSPQRAIARDFPIGTCTTTRGSTALGKSPSRPSHSQLTVPISTSPKVTSLYDRPIRLAWTGLRQRGQGTPKDRRGRPAFNTHTYPTKRHRSTVETRQQSCPGATAWLHSCHYARTSPAIPAMGCLIRQKRQTSPQAQIFTSPDVGLTLGYNFCLARRRACPRAQISALPNAEFDLGCCLCLARARPRLPAPPRIPQASTPPSVAHVREASTIASGRLLPRPSRALTSISVAKESQRHLAQGHWRTP
jgi:hypothetical protein